jgi:hypothetical protein
MKRIAVVLLLVACEPSPATQPVNEPSTTVVIAQPSASPASAPVPTGLRRAPVGQHENDADRDGIPDDVDKCPSIPENFNGVDDQDGCPESAGGDRDGDGVPDNLDQCPDDPEDRDGFEDQDGCPDPDNDKDGIPDAKDKCPNDPETFNGYQDEDGCPDRRP